MSITLFVSSFLMMMVGEKESVRPFILQHLQQLMEYMEVYSWEAIRACHAIWLQQLELGRVTWANEVVKMKYRRALIWHQVMAPPQPTAAPHRQNCQQPQQAYRKAEGKPGDRACVAYNKGTCSDNFSHSQDLHVCTYCLASIKCICYHFEQFCWRKGAGA